VRVKRRGGRVKRREWDGKEEGRVMRSVCEGKEGGGGEREGSGCEGEDVFC